MLDDGGVHLHWRGSSLWEEEEGENKGEEEEEEEEALQLQLLSSLPGFFFFFALRWNPSVTDPSSSLSSQLAASQRGALFAPVSSIRVTSPPN